MKIWTKILNGFAVVLLLENCVNAQNINWRNLESKNIASAQIGYDFGFGSGLGYGRKLNSKLPVVLNVIFSFPTGKNFFDDFKIKTGMQIEAFRRGNFSTTLKGYGVFRNTKNNYSSLFNVGTEFGFTAGYFKPKFSFAGDFSFDKPIFSSIRPQPEAFKYNANLKSVKFFSEGGHFLYGIQTNYSFNVADITFKIGQVRTVDFKPAALIPYYFQLGCNTKL